jgi:anti-sigma regulatory factor (Ser/Thr protein kinase)
VIEVHATVPRDATQLPALTRFLKAFWVAQNLPAAQAPTFELALEEIFMNVVMHGAPAGRAVRVDVTLGLAGKSLTMTIQDDGPEFDPTHRDDPDITAGLAARPVGGLGVFLVRRMMDEVSYDRVGSSNRLRMTKQLAG